MGKKKDKKQKKEKRAPQAAPGYVSVEAAPAPAAPDAPSGDAGRAPAAKAPGAPAPVPAPAPEAAAEPCKADASSAALAQRIALSAFEAADEAHRAALESGAGIERATAALEAALAALAQADAAADALSAGAPGASDEVEAALAAAAKALSAAQQQTIQEPAPQPQPEPQHAAQPEPRPNPRSEHLVAEEQGSPSVILSERSESKDLRPTAPPLAEDPSAPDAARPPLEKTAPLSRASILEGLPQVASDATPSSSGMPSAAGVDEALAPGTLPMSKRELKERERADARAAKEQLRAERSDAKRAAKEEKGAARQSSKDVKREAKKSARVREMTEAAVPVSESVASSISPALPAVAAPDYGKQSHAARNACIVLFLLLLVAAGMVLAAWLGLFRLPSPVQDRIDLLPDLHAQQGKLNAEDSPVAPGSYRLVLNQIPGGDAGSRDVAIEFENPAQNTYSARLDLYLDDTGQMVGSTRMISPGTYLATMALSEDLAPGTYQATAKVGVYSGATQVNTMTAAVELRIKG